MAEYSVASAYIHGGEIMAENFSFKRFGLYRKGWSYCASCMLYFRYKNNKPLHWCPFCGTKLREKPRGWLNRKKDKEIYEKKLVFIDPRKYGVKI